MINSKALGKFAFNSSGVLYLVRATGNSNKFSTYYRDKLVQAIDSPINIQVQQKNITTRSTLVSGVIVPEGSSTPYNVDVDAGGGATWGNAGTNQFVQISGNPYSGLLDNNGNPLVDTAADILLHELLGHAIPKIVGTDTGNAVDNENKAREQITPAKPAVPAVPATAATATKPAVPAKPAIPAIPAVTRELDPTHAE